MSNWDTSPGTQIAQDSNPPWATTPPWPPNPVPGSPGGPQVNDPESWTYGFQPPGGAVAAYPGVVMVGTPPQQVATLADIAAATTGVSSFNTRTGAVTLQLADVTGAGGAPSNNPTFVGSANYVTQPPGTNSTLIATTQFVQAAIGAAGGVSTWNGRSGAVTLTLADVTGVGGAPLASPNLSGVPTTPTAPLGTNTGQVASCSYVMNALGNSVISWNGRIGAVTMTLSDITTAGGAPIASPTFTGVPLVPTASPGTATTQAASTAFVQNAVSAATAGVASFNTRTGDVTLLLSDIESAGGAPLAGPAFTGTPTAPTPAAGSDNNDIATTAFVVTALTGASVVSSFNGRTGTVALTEGDISAADGITQTGGAISGNLSVAGTTTLGTTTLGATTVASTLTLNANAASNLQAVPYQQLVSYTANYAPLSGATFTGPVTLPAGSTVAGYLPTAGGTITGNLTVDGTLNTGGAAAFASIYTNGVANLASTVNIGGTTTFAGFGDFNIQYIAPNRILNWATGWSDVWNTQSGLRGWISGSTLIATLDASGNYTAVGNVASQQQLVSNGHGVVYAIWQNNAVSFAWNGNPAASLANFRAAIDGTVIGGGSLVFGYPNLISLNWNGNLYAWVDGGNQGQIQITPSDARLKDNFAAIDVDCLAAVNKITLQQFDWKPTELMPERPHASCGMIAQDIEAIIPEAVNAHPDDGLMSVDLMPMVAYLIGAVQQLAGEVAGLKRELGVA